MLAAVESVTINAHRGLYLTPDMYAAAKFLIPHQLEQTVADMHKVQPITSDFDVFSDRVNEVYHQWRHITEPNRGMESETYVALGHQIMAVTDLAATREQIRNAMLAATDLALAIMLRTANNSDEYLPYRRAIPDSLDAMRINCIEDINADTYMQILNAEPWVSWLARLRAQRQRTHTALSNRDAAAQLTSSMAIVYARQPKIKARYNLKKIDHKTRRTIRKSADMFQRFLGRDALRDFMSSAPTKPFLIAGRHYNYQLTKRPKTLFKRSNNVNEGTAVFGTQVFNKTGDRLCEVCVYFENTPILDSVVAIALHVQNQETEFELLNQACVTDAPAKFYDDPVLPDLKGLTQPNMAPTLIENIGYHADSFDALRESMQRETLSHVYAAFRKINRPGKQYFPIMQMCGKFSIWDYLNGEAGAIAFMKLAQTQIERGLF